mmetsp:Transcript_10045/g.41439  ORF Transcript_10045/g.41439 Transcript_10045/m.41439 type:complete len:546 (+) Transcript_10045:262-1899(+)
MRDGTPDAGFLWRIGVGTLVYLNRAIAGLPVPNAVRRAIHSAGTRCIPAAMLTQASWRAPVSSAAAAAPGLATAVVPPRTPAIRAPVVSPPGDDRDANEPNPFGVHPGDVDDASARFRLDECAGIDRGSDSGCSDDDDDPRDDPPDDADDVVAEYLEVDVALNAGDENDPPSPRREERDEPTRRPLARVDNGAVAGEHPSRWVVAAGVASKTPHSSVEGRRSKDGTPLPPTPRDVGDRFLRDASGRHLCVVLDLDETLVCAYNHEVKGGVPPELSTPEAVAKTTRFTLHKDPRHGTHHGTHHGGDAIAPGEPVPLVASTTTRGGGDWARAIGAEAPLADRIDRSARCAGDLGEPVCTVIERPGVREFLAQLSTFAEVCVFTAGMEGYARPLLDAIDPAGDAIHHRLYRQACVTTPIRDHVKDISRLGRDLSATVIVDNNPFSFLLQPHNGIPIVSFTGDPGDDGLSRQLLPVLQRLGETVARGEDVRPFCRRRFKIEPFFRRYYSQQGIEFDPPREPWEEELEREGTMPMREVGRKKRGGLLTSR